MEGASFYKADLRGADFGGSTSLTLAKLGSATISINTDIESAYFEVMTLPPESYAYLELSYGPTVLPPNSKGVVNCPNGSVSSANDCGPTTGDDGLLSTYWSPSAGLDVLTGCALYHNGDPTQAGVASNGDYIECAPSGRRAK